MQKGLIWGVIKEFFNSSNEITEIKYFDGYYYDLGTSNVFQYVSIMFEKKLYSTDDFSLYSS